MRELKQLQPAASISGPTDTNTAQVEFGKPTSGGFLTDLTILNAPTDDNINWTANGFDNVDMEATNVGRLRFQATGDVNITKGPQPSGTVSDFDQSASATQAWKEDSPGFVNLDWVGAIAVAPIPTSEVILSNGWSTLIVDQKQAGGEIWKIIRGTETSETDVYNLRAEVHTTAQTTVSVSNDSGSNVIISTPSSFSDKPSGAGDATAPSTEVQAYYASAPWSINLPMDPFTIVVTKPGLGRMEVAYQTLDGQTAYKVSPTGSTNDLEFDETEVQVFSDITWTYSFASGGTASFGIDTLTIENTDLTIQPNPQSGLYSGVSTGSGTFISSAFSGSTLDLVGNDLNMVRTPEAKLNQLWLEGMAPSTNTSTDEADLLPLHRMMRLEGNDAFFAFEQAIFRYESTKMTFDSTSAVADAEEVMSFMRSIDTPSIEPQVASNNATPSDYVSITQLPLVVSAAEIGGIVIEDVERSLNDLTNDVLGDVAFGIPPEEPYPGTGSLKP